MELTSLVAISISVSIFLITSTVAIIRNDITDRCLHIDSANKDSAALNYRTGQRTTSSKVYARSCTWDMYTNMRKTKSHANQWVEIVPSIPFTAEEEMQPYFIRKVTEDITETCLASVNNEPVPSTECPSDEATFTIERIHQKQELMTSMTSFKIRNANGHCLTVQPGSEDLKFTNCSERAGLFQIWGVCRHMRKCDVDLTWTPRKIELPYPNDLMNYQRQNKTSPIKHIINVGQQNPNGAIRNSQNDIIVNEVLYSVQNALRIFDSSDDFIIGTISAFYPLDSVAEATREISRICEEKSMKSCTSCKDHSSTKSNSAHVLVGFLMKWMNECNSQHVFVSKDVLLVPLQLFPIAESSFDSHGQKEDEKVKSIIASLRKYLHRLEEHNGDDDMNIPQHSTTSAKERPDNNGTDGCQNNMQPTSSSQNAMQMESGSTESSGNSGPTQNLQTNHTDDYVHLIDIRLQLGSTTPPTSGDVKNGTV